MKTTPAAETSLEKPLDDIPSFSNSIQFNLTVSVGLLAFVKSFSDLGNKRGQEHTRAAAKS